MGNSGGVFGAVQVGLDLGAQSVLCLAGNTGLTPRLRSRVAAELPKSETFDPALLDLRYRYKSSTAYPRMRHIYGDAHKVDRVEAERFKGLEGVELLPLAGWTEHLVIDALIGKDEFVPTLEWMLGAKAVVRGDAAEPKIGQAGPLPVSAKTEQVFRAVRREWWRARLLAWLKRPFAPKKEALGAFLALQPLAQLRAQDLADSVAGQVGHEHEPAWPLVGREMGAAMRHQIGFADLAGRNDEGRDLLAFARFGETHHGDLLDALMPGKHGFDLSRMHIGPGANDQVRAAGEQPDEAVFIEQTDIAGIGPAVLEPVAVGARIVAVGLLRHSRRAHADESFRAGGENTVAVIDHLHLDIGQRPADRLGLRVEIGAAQRGDAAAEARPVFLDEIAAEPRLGLEASPPRASARRSNTARRESRIAARSAALAISSQLRTMVGTVQIDVALEVKAASASSGAENSNG